MAFYSYLQEYFYLFSGKFVLQHCYQLLGDCLYSKGYSAVQNSPEPLLSQHKRTLRSSLPQTKFQQK